MGTKSTIGIIEKNGTIKTIYCNWDGYLSYNGLHLEKYYQDPIKVKKLIALGNISSLKKEVDIPEGVNHDFDTKDTGITIAYARDRGDEKQEAEVFATIEDAVNNSAYYFYLFNETEGKWYVNKSEDKVNLLDLKKELLKEKEVSSEDKIIIKNGKVFDELNEELQKPTKKTKNNKV